MREQCAPIFREARRAVLEADMGAVAGDGAADPSPVRRSASRRLQSTDSDRTAGTYS